MGAAAEKRHFRDSPAFGLLNWKSSLNLLFSILALPSFEILSRKSFYPAEKKIFSIPGSTRRI